jgi:hypothetical protein
MNYHHLELTLNTPSKTVSPAIIAHKNKRSHNVMEEGLVWFQSSSLHLIIAC